ncbi:MAG: tRNA adenosine(34) deaminase TadA [Bdellovibrionales bacterium]|nr:tRNA adenosine(34) deaminase TadA [Bdellovibrionales bacterium]
MSKDEDFMKIALEEAKKAELIGEIPIGALVVDQNDEIIGRGHNQKESGKDPTLHAEIIAIREASKKLQNWRLNGCRLYVTLEPCPMCAGALVNSRIEHLFIGTEDAKGGGVCSKFQIGINEALNHQFQFTTGVLREECSEILKSFFKVLRKNKLGLPKK